MVRYVTNMYACLLEDLSSDGFLERFARFKKPGKARVKSLGPFSLSTEQDLLSIMGDNAHNDRRICPRILRGASVDLSIIGRNHLTQKLLRVVGVGQMPRPSSANTFPSVSKRFTKSVDANVSPRAEAHARFQPPHKLY